MFPLLGGIATDPSKRFLMRWPAIIFVSLCLWALFGLCGCRGSEPSTSPTPAVESVPDGPQVEGSPDAEKVVEVSARPDRQVRVQGSTITTRKGQPWKLEADEVDWLDSRKAADARGVTWYLLDPEGEPFVRVEAPAAEVDVEGELVTFVGEVLASRLDSDEELTVQRLVYEGTTRQFFGSGGVIWTRVGYELTGETLTASAQLDKVQLKGNVQGRFLGVPGKVGRKPGSEER